MKPSGIALLTLLWSANIGLYLNPQTALATTREVGPSSPYATVQAAYAAAQPGDTILIHAGTYPARLHVYVPNLTITGAGDGPAVLQFPSASAPAATDNVITVLAPGVTISNLTIDGSYHGEAYYCTYGVKFTGWPTSGPTWTGTLTGCTLKNTSDALVKCAAPVNAATSTNPGLSVMIDQCEIYKDAGVPMLRNTWTAVDSLMPNTVVENCRIHDVMNGITFKGGVSGCQAVDNTLTNIASWGIGGGAYDGGYVFNVNSTNPFFQSCLGCTIEGNTLTNCGVYGIVLMGAANSRVDHNTLVSCGKLAAAVWIQSNSYTPKNPAWGHCSGVVFTNNTVDVATGTFVPGSYTWQAPAVKINDTMMDKGTWTGNTYTAAGFPWFADLGQKPFITGFQSPKSGNPPTSSNFGLWQRRYTETGSTVGPTPVPTPTGGVP